MADSGIVCSISPADPATSGTTRRWRSFLGVEDRAHRAQSLYRTKNEARADVFDHIERFDNATRLIGYFSPVEFERKGLA
jgi:putative transposase